MKILNFVIPKSIRINRFGDLFKILSVGVISVAVFKFAELIGQKVFFFLVIGGMGLVMAGMLWAIWIQWKDPAVRDKVLKGFRAWREQGRDPGNLL